MHNKLRYLTLLVLALVLIAGARFATGQDERKTAPQLRREMATAAADALKSLNDRLEAGEAQTPQFVELMLEWSRRVYLSSVAADGAREARAQAAREHLARVKQHHQILTARFGQGLDVSRVQVAQATYYLREAELWVLESQGQ